MTVSRVMREPYTRPEGAPYPLAFVPWDWWGELPLAGLNTLEEAVPLLAQAGELCAELG